MGTVRINVLKSSPSTRFQVEADLSQNIAGNYSRITCYLKCINAGGTTSVYGSSGYQRGSIDGIGTWRTHSGNPFLPSGVAGGATRWYEGPYHVDIPHDAEGFHANAVVRMRIDYGNIDEQHTYTFTLPRIPKPPAKPAAPTLTAEGPGEIKVTWTAPDAMGATITGYTIRHADNEAMTGATTVSVPASPREKLLTGLAPGEHWVQVLATNSRGNSAYSDTSSLDIGIGGKRFDGTSFVPFTISKRKTVDGWVDLSIAKRKTESGWVDIS